MALTTEFLAAVRAGDVDARQQLVDFVRSEDPAQRRAVIEAYLPVCAYHVSQAGATANETQRAEAESECHLTLVETVARIAKDTQVDDVDAYLTKAIRATANVSLAQSAAISVPRRTVGRQKNKPPQDRAKAPEVVGLAGSDDPLADFSSGRRFTDDPSGADTWEELLACCQRECERELLELLLVEGLDMSEATEQLGVNANAGYVWLRAIQGRFEERNRD
jgi:hypothetical protein